MDLLNKLIAAGREIPPSHLPSPNDLVHLVGALVAHVEHGPQFLQATEQGADGVAAFINDVARAENDVVAAEQTTPPAAGASVASTIAGAAVTSAPPAAAAPAPVAGPTDPVPGPIPPTPAQPDQTAPATELSDAEIVAQIEALQATLGQRQRTTITTA